MLDEPEPLVLLPDWMPLDPALDPEAFAWRSRQFWSAVPVRPVHDSVLEAPAEGEPMVDGLDEPGMGGLTLGEPMFGELMPEEPLVPPVVP